MTMLDPHQDRRRREREAQEADAQQEAERRRSQTKRWLRLIDNDKAELDFHDLQAFTGLLEFEDPALYHDLKGAILARRARETEVERQRADAEREAAVTALRKQVPGRIASMTATLKGDAWNQAIAEELSFLLGCVEVSSADKGALQDLRPGHAKRVETRVEHERVEAELAEQAASERAEREREAAWRSLSREARAVEMFVRALPAALRPAFRAFAACVRDSSFDPQQAPEGWEAQPLPGAAALIARIPATLPFAPPAKAPEREPQGRSYGHGYQMNGPSR